MCLKNSNKINCFAFSPYPVEGASFRYRVLQYKDMMQKAGIDLKWYSFLDSFFYKVRRKSGPIATCLKITLGFISSIRLMPALARAAGSDVIIVHREIFPIGPPFLESVLRRMGGKIVFDIDDAIFHVPTAGLDQRRFLRDPDRVAKTARLSMAVTVGSPYLQDKISSWNSNCYFFPTSIDTDIYRPECRSGNPFPVVGWIGNWGNAIYLKELVSVFSEIAVTHKFVLRLVGGDDIYEIRPSGVNVDYRLWKLSNDLADLASFDIGIMPLSGGRYDLGKGGFKLIQYMGMGIPVVASPVGMNNQVVEHGKNGFLASGPAEWVKCLGKLIEDQGLRKEFGSRGREKVEKFYSKKVTGGKLIELLRTIAGEHDIVHGSNAADTGSVN